MRAKDRLLLGRHHVSRAIKILIAHGLYYTGALQLWLRYALRRRAVVLMYHRILSADERRRTGSHPGIVVDQRTFANHMAVVRRRFAPLSVNEFARCMEEGAGFPDSACLITFDDGWEDNYHHGLPVLREHGLPAVVFLPVNYIASDRLFWRESLTHAIVELVLRARSTPALRARGEALLAPVGLAGLLDISAEDPRPQIVETIASKTGLTAAQAECVLRKLSAEADVRVDPLRTPDTFIDWEQAAVMKRHGVAFGGHGADHHLLTDISAEQADSEIQAPLGVMREILDGTVPTFSYPNGNWNPELAASVKGAGYRLAFTTAPGSVGTDDDRFTIRRVNIHETATDSTPMFLARVAGLF